MTRESEGRQSVMVCERGRGRPKKESSYDYVLKVRISEDELLLLQDLENEFDLTRSEAIRQAIQTFHNLKIRWR